jgi:hypothetical protein
MAGQPHLLRANRMPPLVPVTQLHAVGCDGDDPEPTPTPRHLHPRTHPNPARRLGTLDRRGRSYPTSSGMRGWVPHRVGLGADYCTRRLRPHSAHIVVASELQRWDSTMEGEPPRSPQRVAGLLPSSTCLSCSWRSGCGLRPGASERVPSRKVVHLEEITTLR